MTTQNRARPTARPHDTTGRKSEQLKLEHAEELAAREGQISTITVEAARSKNEDIVDLDTNEVIKPDGSVTKLVEDDDNEVVLIGSGPVKIEEIAADPQPKQTIATGLDPNERVVITVAVDLEDVTLGYGNTYTFKGGSKYRVARWQAEHLNERGLVWQYH